MHKTILSLGLHAIPNMLYRDRTPESIGSVKYELLEEITIQQAKEDHAEEATVSMNLGTSRMKKLRIKWTVGMISPNLLRFLYIRLFHCVHSL